MTVAATDHAHRLEGLRAARLTIDAARLAAVPCLGGLTWGAEAQPLATLPAPVLDGVAGADLWCCGPTPAEGTTGRVHWRDDGRFVFGHIDIAEGGADLAEAARLAYLDVFATLAATGAAHLLRLWNYLPRINEVTDGLERYRRFNIGRQRAFIESGRSPFEGAPAACALGTGSDALAIRFLAARTPVVAIENPRQVSAYRYSAAFGPRSPTFSRAALAEVGGGRIALFISGTASIVGERSVHDGDARAQLDETLRNLDAVIEAAQARTDARFEPSRFDWIAYLRRPNDLPVLRPRMAAWAPGAQIAWLRADICRSELLVEIEGHAIEAGALTR
jgi:hypothetical protein